MEAGRDSRTSFASLAVEKPSFTAGLHWCIEELLGKLALVGRLRGDCGNGAKTADIADAKIEAMTDAASDDSGGVLLFPSPAKLAADGGIGTAPAAMESHTDLWPSSGGASMSTCCSSAP